MSFDWRPADEPPQNRSEAEQCRDAKTLVEHMDKIWKEAAESLKHAQDTAVQAANKKRKDVNYEPGKDEAYLSSKDLKTQRPSQKLEQLWFGPYPVQKRIGNAYRLKLPPEMKVNPEFHPSRLRKAAQDPLPGQNLEPQDPLSMARTNGKSNGS